jgi:peroxisomal membrane protein 2
MSFATLVLEGRTFAFLKDKISRDYPSVQLTGWKLWPLASFINFKWVWCNITDI